MAEQWLSIVEYARAYSISDMTVRRRIKTGKLNAVLREGKYYIPIRPDGHVNKAFANHGPALGESPLPRQGTRANHPEQHHRPNNDHHQDTVLVKKQHHAPARSYGELANRQTMIQEKPDPRPTGHMIGSPINDGRLDRMSHRIDKLAHACESTLRRFHDLEKHVEGSYRARMDALEAQIQAKDAEVSKFRQQVEDLQLLVKMLERKRSQP